MGGNGNRKKRPKVLLALFLVMVMAITGIPLKEAMVVRAEGTEPQPDLVIGVDSTVDAISGSSVTSGEVTIADGLVTIDSLTIEPDHFVIIEGARVHVQTLNLKERASVEVVNHPVESDPTDIGALSWNNLVAEPGARMRLQSKVNIPEGMQIYRWRSPEEEVEGGDPLVLALEESDLAGIDRSEIEYTVLEGEVTGRWVLVPSGPEGGGAGDPQESEKVGMLQEGLKRLDEEQGVAYHAYGNQVYSDQEITNNDDNENTTVDDLRLGWAKYLAREFAVGEGRYQGIGEAIGLAANTEENKRSNDEKVLNMITCLPQPAENKIVAKDMSGANHELSAYTLTFKPVLVETQQYTPEERVELEAIKVTTTAYMIEKGDVSSGNTYAQVVIKVGNEFYIRNAAGGENEEYKCLGSGNNDNTRALNIVTEQLNGSESVVVFGNNASLSSEKLSDDSAKEYFVNNFNSNENGVGMGGKVAIYRPTFTGVFLKPDSETNKEAWAWETNTSYDIKESGEKSETDFYFGYGKAIISPLTGTSLDGIPVKELTNVEVLGGIPENAVKVVKNADKTFTLEFLSDFYDQVQLQLTYLMNDETEKQNTLTINRVGIVLQYGRTPGDDKTRVQIYHGHQSGEFISNDGKEMGGVIYATYYHPQGTGNIESSDTSLYVTLHYRDGRTEQRIIKASFFKEEDSGHTAMSDYVIAIAPQEGNLEDLLPTYVEAIAVENADESGRFNGAKLGAGKGVHCDVVFDE
ncbi:MAG: hypothetical protein MR356_05205 [Agathobacter sp.]|nr:hypothetical protein [Agathobacter sp.]